jgi:hypothetical protein
LTVISPRFEAVFQAAPCRGRQRELEQYASRAKGDQDEQKIANQTLASTQVRNESEVNVARRRALIQAGWAVPTLLVVGLPPRYANAYVQAEVVHRNGEIENFVFPTTQVILEPGDTLNDLECSPNPCTIVALEPVGLPKGTFIINDP